ncbi:MAG: hypothetical protein AVDCRST_MAG49-3909 [uncultured Thermomicrobiales bacterium]|uniref:Uncharacterized protein n=1 Tax=uncultured Thermomicrobiales bacterium TaxID=1645740 RepID=A0A6J4VF07_9BACT|nr:MAG: hypothetical protein AVDCRST_MAG49-3909 [uncultured Thermomicrobiales bacterium]
MTPTGSARSRRQGGATGNRWVAPLGQRRGDRGDDPAAAPTPRPGTVDRQSATGRLAPTAALDHRQPAR